MFFNFCLKFTVQQFEIVFLIKINIVATKGALERFWTTIIMIRYPIPKTILEQVNIKT